jgi:ABC-type Fe3+ transport system permease subunit
VRGSSAWVVSAVGIASILAIPSLVVLASLAHPAHDVWIHLWRTQPPELIGNTLTLLAGVGAGTLVVGTGLAWLVVAYRFPGSGVLEWALVLPLAVPAYVIGFAFLGLFDFAGPAQTALRRWLGDWRAGAFAALLANTVALAALAALAAAVLALVLAYAARLSPSAPVRASARAASMAYALPGTVIAVGVLLSLAWLDRVMGEATALTLGRSAGLVLTGSVFGLLFAYVVRFLSVSLQTMESSLAKIPTSFDDAARSLGTSVGGTLRRIHLPLMRGGVLTAVVLVFVETMKEMPATLLLRPLGLDTLAVAVWERTSESLWADAAAPALAIVAAGLVPVLVAIRLSASRQRSRD